MSCCLGHDSSCFWRGKIEDISRNSRQNGARLPKKLQRDNRQVSTTLGSVRKNLLGCLGVGGLMRNYLLSEKSGGPLLAALNIFRDPLLVSLKTETPPTYLMPGTNTRSRCRSQNEGNKLSQKQKNASKEHNDLPKNAEKRQGKSLESQLSH